MGTRGISLKRPRKMSGLARGLSSHWPEIQKRFSVSFERNLDKIFIFVMPLLPEFLGCVTLIVTSLGYFRVYRVSVRLTPVQLPSLKRRSFIQRKNVIVLKRVLKFHT